MKKMRGIGMAGIVALISALAFTGPVCAQQPSSLFEFELVDTQKISGRFVITGEEVLIDWGDGTRELLFSGRQNFSKDYGEFVNTRVKLFAKSGTAITEFRMTDNQANITFDLKDLPEGMTFLQVRGNTIIGNIADLPGTLEYFNVWGSNTVTGDIKDLKEGLTFFELAGSNTLSGDIGNLPGTLRVFNNYGPTRITGDIKGLPEGMTRFRAEGRNTVTGDVGDLPRGMTSFGAMGRSTVTGDIAGLPPGLTYMRVDGNNTLSGDVKNMPPGVRVLMVTGSNTLSGDIASVPEGITWLRCRGSQISDYTGGRNWAEGMQEVNLGAESGFGLTTGEVDSLIMDLAGTSWRSGGEIIITGGNSPRSSASDEAVKVLEGLDVTVTTN